MLDFDFLQVARWLVMRWANISESVSACLLAVQSTHLINTDKGNNRGLLKPVELCFLSHVSSKTRLCQVWTGWWIFLYRAPSLCARCKYSSTVNTLRITRMLSLSGLHWWLVKRAHPSSGCSPRLCPPLSANFGQSVPEPRAPQTGSSSLVIMCTVRTHDNPAHYFGEISLTRKDLLCISCKRTFFIAVVWGETVSGVIQTIDRRVETGRLQTPDSDRTRFCQTHKWIFSLHDILRELIILYFLPPCAKSNELLNYLILSLFNVSSQVFAKWKGRTVFISSA